MNTNMNKPFELKVIVAFDERWDIVRSVRSTVSIPVENMIAVVVSLS